MRVFTFIALVALAGCDFDSGPILEAAENRCADDGSCIQGVCAEDICVDATNASIEVAVEIVNDGSSVTPPIPSSWAYGPERFSGPSIRDWLLPATREVRGTVRWAGERVPCRLRFVRRLPGSVEPLQPIPLEVDTMRVTTDSREQLSFDYSARLVEGETYDLVVLPTEDTVVSPQSGEAAAIRSLPPLYLEVVVGSNADGEPLRFDVEFPEAIAFACDSFDGSGCSIQAQVLTFDGETDIPEPGLQVRAVDVATGRVVSSVAETAENGRFSIRLSPGAADYFLRITPSVGGAPFPAVSVDPEVLLGEDNPGKVIRIPRLESVQYGGVVRDGSGAAVAGANVRLFSTAIFDGSELGLMGSFSGSAITNEDGTFGLELLQGFYSLQVTPPEGVETGWGVLATEVAVIEGLEEMEPLVVPEKVELIGEVSTLEGEVAPGLNVLARARQDEDGQGMNRSQETATGADGVFVMQMDRGLYDLRISAPEGSGYAWVVHPALVVEEDASRTFAFVPPVPIEGRVLSSSGGPVPGVQLRAYTFAAEGDDRRLLQVAETTSDEEGRVRLLIAPGLDE